MRRWRFVSWFLIALLILVIFSQLPKLNETVHNLFYSISRPFLVAGAGVRDFFGDIRYNFGRFWNAVAKEREYQARIMELETKLLRFNEMDKENRRLKKLLNFVPMAPFKTVGVRIIGEDSTPWKSVILLDKGTKQGIKQDMVLVAPEGLVGRILDAGPSTARGMLLLDPDSRVSALTAENRIQGVITGVGSKRLQMKYLALDAEVTIGEDVITSGVGSFFPKGLQIGKIESVEKDPDGLHLLASVRPSAPFSRLEELLCLVSQTSK